MKILPADLNELKAAIDAIMPTIPVAMVDYKAQGLSAMRFRWDVLALSGFDVSKLYAYLNDSHIDTALRRILGDC